MIMIFFRSPPSGTHNENEVSAAKMSLICHRVIEKPLLTATLASMTNANVYEDLLVLLQDSHFKALCSRLLSPLFYRT